MSDSAPCAACVPKEKVKSSWEKSKNWVIIKSECQSQKQMLNNPLDSSCLLTLLMLAAAAFTHLNSPGSNDTFFCECWYLCQLDISVSYWGNHFIAHLQRRKCHCQLVATGQTCRAPQPVTIQYCTSPATLHTYKCVMCALGLYYHYRNKRTFKTSLTVKEKGSKQAFYFITCLHIL